eukprot:6467922-Amphidinium_carterae.1
MPAPLRPLWFDPVPPEVEGKRLLDPKAWGGESAIWAAAQALSLDVRVHTPDTVLVYGPHDAPARMVVHLAYNGVDHYDAVQPTGSGEYKRQRIKHTPAGPRNDRDVRAAVARHGFALDKCAWAPDWMEALDAKFAWDHGRTRLELEAELDRATQLNTTVNSFLLGQRALREGRVTPQLFAVLADIVACKLVIFDNTVPREYGGEYKTSVILVYLSDGIHSASPVQSCLKASDKTASKREKPSAPRPKLASPLDILAQATHKRDADLGAHIDEQIDNCERVHFEALNVISVSACFPDILVTRADVYICSECNLQASDVAEFRALANSKGYIALIPSSSKAGVVVLARTALLRCWELHIPELQPWIDQGRVMPVRLTTHTGALVAVVIAIYANQAGASATAARATLRDDFTDLFQAVEEYVISAGSAPIVVVGDLNVPIEGQRSLNNLTMAGVLTDVVAQSLDGPRLPTCTGSNAIDHMLVTRAVLYQNAVATQSTHRWPQDHTVLDLFLDVRQSCSCLTKLKVPAALPKECAVPLLCEAADDWHGPLNTSFFEKLLELGEMDKAYELWSASWETLLLDRASQQGADAEPDTIGRGSGPGYIQYVPRTGASKSDGKDEPICTPWRCLQNRLRRVRALLRKGDPLGADEKKVLHDTAFHLCDGWHLDLDAEPLLACDFLLDKVLQKIMGERRRKRAARLQAWQTTLSHFNDPFSARSHKYIRGDWVQPLTCVTLDDGS